VLATSSAHPRVIKISLLYGLLNRGEAYLIPTWLMPEQRLAHLQINQSIKSITHTCTHACAHAQIDASKSWYVKYTSEGDCMFDFLL